MSDDAACQKTKLAHLINSHLCMFGYIVAFVAAIVMVVIPLTTQFLITALQLSSPSPLARCAPPASQCCNLQLTM